MKDKRMRILLLYFMIAVLACVLLLELTLSDADHAWVPLNQQLEDWLVMPDELDPHQYKVDINRAQGKQLEQLPGIGPSKALAIIAFRESLPDGFTALEELMQVKGIGAKTFENIRHMITLNGSLKDQFASSCSDLEAAGIRILRPDSKPAFAAEEQLQPLCRLIEEAAEIVEEEPVQPAIELRFVYKDGLEHVLYCEQDFKACKLGSIQDGTVYGLNLNASKEISFLIDNSNLIGIH